MVDEVAPALAAVEAELGGPQDYFEVNATPQLVNVFVAVDDATAAVAYVYLDGELGPAAPEQPASGATFTAEAAAFDPGTVLAGIDDDLPDSDIGVFSIIGGPDGAVQFGAVVALRPGRDAGRRGDGRRRRRLGGPRLTAMPGCPDTPLVR